MFTIIQSTTYFSNLFSQILTLFTTSSHNTARFVLVKCVGEILRSWSLSFILLKKDEIIQLIINGVRDRAGEVRDGSRILFCLLYCRCFSSYPTLPQSEHLSSDECNY